MQSPRFASLCKSNDLLFPEKEAKSVVLLRRRLWATQISASFGSKETVRPLSRINYE
jgi:hypothetical protein